MDGTKADETQSREGWINIENRRRRLHRSPPKAYAVSCENRDFRESRGEPQAVEEAVRTALSQVAKPCLPWNT